MNIERQPLNLILGLGGLALMGNIAVAVLVFLYALAFEGGSLFTFLGSLPFIVLGVLVIVGYARNYLAGPGTS